MSSVTNAILEAALTSAITSATSYRGTSSPSEPAVYATLDSTNKSASINLSNGDLTATASTTAWKTAIGTLALSTGKHTFEVTLSTAGSAHSIMVGLGGLTEDVNNHCGTSATQWTYLNASGGEKWHNNAKVEMFFPAETNDDVVTVYWDADAGKMWVAVNGVVFGGGDPAAGTSPLFTGVTGSLTPNVSPYNDTSVVECNFGQSSIQYPATGFRNGFFTGDPV
jgi:hypothetical protein